MPPTSDAVRLEIRRASFVAAGLGVVLSPVPLVDEILLVPTCCVLAGRISRARGVSLRATPWRAIAVTAMTGLVARAAVNLTVSYIPVVAAIANAASAVALTRFLGRYIDASCAQVAAGGEVRPLGLSEIAAAVQRAPSTA